MILSAWWHVPAFYRNLVHLTNESTSVPFYPFLGCRILHTWRSAINCSIILSYDFYSYCIYLCLFIFHLVWSQPSKCQVELVWLYHINNSLPWPVSSTVLSPQWLSFGIVLLVVNLRSLIFLLSYYACSMWSLGS